MSALFHHHLCNGTGPVSYCGQTWFLAKMLPTVLGAKFDHADHNGTTPSFISHHIQKLWIIAFGQVHFFFGKCDIEDHNTKLGLCTCICGGETVQMLWVQIHTHSMKYPYSARMTKTEIRCRHPKLLWKHSVEASPPKTTSLVPLCIYTLWKQFCHYDQQVDIPFSTLLSLIAKHSSRLAKSSMYTISWATEASAGRYQVTDINTADTRFQGGGIKYWNQYRLTPDTATWLCGLEVTLHSFSICCISTLVFGVRCSIGS